MTKPSYYDCTGGAAKAEPKTMRAEDVPIGGTFTVSSGDIFLRAQGGAVFGDPSGEPNVLSIEDLIPFGRVTLCDDGTRLILARVPADFDGGSLPSGVTDEDVEVANKIRAEAGVCEARPMMRRILEDFFARKTGEKS